MMDAAALESVVREGFASEFGFQVDNAIINGSGSGQPLGILNSGSRVTVEQRNGPTNKNRYGRERD